MLYKWNRNTGKLLGLVFFTQYDSLEMNLDHCIDTSFSFLCIAEQYSIVWIYHSYIFNQYRE